MLHYLNIIDELASSDTYLFLIAGCIIALISLTKKSASYKHSFLMAFCIYVICEVALNISILSSNYMVQIILLQLGTVALGAALGYLGILLVKKKKAE